MTAEGIPSPRSPRRNGREGERRNLRRVPILVLVVGCLVGAAVLESSRPDSSTARALSTSAGPTLPPAGDLSASWFCAEGTAQPDGRANETVVVANVGATEAQATITVLPSSDDETAETRRISVEPGEQVRVPVLDILESPEQLDPAGVLRGPGVIVEVLGGRSIVEHEIEGEEDYAIGPCTRDAGRRWYFAAGTTERGVDQHLSLLNPFEGDAIVDVEFITEEGVQNRADLQALVVPRRSRITVPVQNFERRRERIATLVTTRSGRVVAEQSNRFTSEHETSRGLTLSLGAPRIDRSWTLPSVSGGGGTTQRVSVANFEPTATDVEVIVRGEQGVVDPETTPLPGRSAVLIDLGPRLTSAVPVTVLVRSVRSTPIVVEQWASFDATVSRGVAATLGSVATSNRWVFAVGRLEPESDALISVYDPSRSSSTVRLVSYVGSRRDVVSEEDLDSDQPLVFDLTELDVGPDQVVIVEADVPVIAGRMVTGPAGRSISAGVLDDAG